MRKIIFFLSAGFAGMDAHESEVYPDDVTNEELDDESWERAVQHAETYGIYPEADLEYISDEGLKELEESGEIDNYTHNIEGWWEDYVPEKHDGLI